MGKDVSRNQLEDHSLAFIWHLLSGYHAIFTSLLSVGPSDMASKSMETVNELLSGSVGGAAQVLVGQPLDTIKTRAQIAPSSVC